MANFVMYILFQLKKLKWLNLVRTVNTMTNFNLPDCYFPLPSFVVALKIKSLQTTVAMKPISLAASGRGKTNLSS